MTVLRIALGLLAAAILCVAWAIVWTALYPLLLLLDWAWPIAPDADAGSDPARLAFGRHR